MVRTLSNSTLSRLAILDLDGTLLNTIADLGEACNYALRCNDFPEHHPDEYPHLVGNGVNKLIERALPEGHKDEATVLRLRDTFIPYYDTHNMVHTQPYEGITEVLQHLRKAGYRLAVASNKYQQATETLVAHFFPNMFDVVYGERPGVPRKPNPQIVFDILHTLSEQETLSPSAQSPKMEMILPNATDETYKSICLYPASIAKDETKVPSAQPSNSGSVPTSNSTKCGLTSNSEAAYIGDSLVDIATARNAHLPVIACAWGFCAKQDLIDAHPDYLITEPKALKEILSSLPME